jgi:hypothetical protein
MCGTAADRWSGPVPWMSRILHNGDIRSHFSDREPASSLDLLGQVGAAMSPFYADGDLAGTPVSFSPSVRKLRGSQVGWAVLRQDIAGSQVQIPRHSHQACAAIDAVPRYCAGCSRAPTPIACRSRMRQRRSRPRGAGPERWRWTMSRPRMPWSRGMTGKPLRVSRGCPPTG